MRSQIETAEYSDMFNIEHSLQTLWLISVLIGPRSVTIQNYCLNHTYFRWVSSPQTCLFVTCSPGTRY